VTAALLFFCASGPIGVRACVGDHGAAVFVDLVDHAVGAPLPYCPQPLRAVPRATRHTRARLFDRLNLGETSAFEAGDEVPLPFGPVLLDRGAFDGKGGIILDVGQ
jgi:hypothetical protein